MASSYVRHGLGKYPFRQVVQCRVCASVHRAKIERAWADGVPPGLILGTAFRMATASAARACRGT